MFNAFGTQKFKELSHYKLNSHYVSEIAKAVKSEILLQFQLNLTVCATAPFIHFSIYYIT